MRQHALPAPSGPIFVVTVTYGQRRALLEQMLEATVNEGVTHVVVVDNGAGWDVGEMQQRHAAVDLHLVRMKSNQGSAAGFAAGIAAAMNAGARMIWLLDDDNRPQSGALGALLAAGGDLLSGDGESSNALLAFRPEHQADVAMGLPQKRINPKRSSFLGFHVLDIPFKIWRRLARGRRSTRTSQAPLPKLMDLDVAPYSGLLLHRALIDRIGLPRTEFVLYADDTEFTHRITSRGGRIVLVTDARVEDMESSWNVKHRHATSMQGHLCGEGDFRAYYSLRNATYFQAHCRPHNAIVFWLNRACYMGMLRVLALLTRRRQRHRLIVRAVRDGLRGRLGICPELPL